MAGPIVPGPLLLFVPGKYCSRVEKIQVLSAGFIPGEDCGEDGLLR